MALKDYVKLFFIVIFLHSAGFTNYGGSPIFREGGGVTKNNINGELPKQGCLDNELVG